MFYSTDPSATPNVNPRLPAPFRLLIRLWVVMAALLSSTAYAQAEPEEIPWYDLHPTAYGGLPLAHDWGDGRAAIGLKLGLKTSHTGRNDYGAGVIIQLPMASWLGAAPAPAKAAANEDLAPLTPTSGQSLKAKHHWPAKSEPEEEQQAVETEPPATAPRLIPRIEPRDARAAVAAALKEMKLGSAADRIDQLGSRARWSAALPKLRLRATRLIDESSALSPTSYDADRVTSSGGASLWLEARATWHLDRALFASEEVRLEGLRRQLAASQQRRSAQVLKLLFAWQSAAFVLVNLDPSSTQLSPLELTERCGAAWLREQQLAAELDIITGGWFAGWRQQHGALDPPCLRPAPVPEQTDQSADSDE